MKDIPNRNIHEVRMKNSVKKRLQTSLLQLKKETWYTSKKHILKIKTESKTKASIEDHSDHLTLHFDRSQFISKF